MDKAKELYPQLISQYDRRELITILSDELNLAPDTIKYSYLPILERRYNLKKIEKTDDENYEDYSIRMDKAGHKKKTREEWDKENKKIKEFDKEQAKKKLLDT